MHTQERRNQITKFLKARKVRGQDQFLKYLQNKGLKITQATLSRDLRKIGAHKHNGYYALEPMGYALNKFSQVLSMQYVEPNMIVIQTTPGLAQSAALLLDQSPIEGVAGTVAGDDTIFVCIHSKKSHSGILRSISEAFRVRRRP